MKTLSKLVLPQAPSPMITSFLFIMLLTIASPLWAELILRDFGVYWKNKSSARIQCRAYGVPPRLRKCPAQDVPQCCAEIRSANWLATLKVFLHNCESMYSAIGRTANGVESLQILKSGAYLRMMFWSVESDMAMISRPGLGALPLPKELSLVTYC